MIIHTVRAADGKLHPVEPVPAGTAALVRVYVHRLRCERRLSERQVQEALLTEFGLRRSLGRIHAVLADFACPWCRETDG